jgi:hypothetical protein
MAFMLADNRFVKVNAAMRDGRIHQRKADRCPLLSGNNHLDHVDDNVRRLPLLGRDPLLSSVTNGTYAATARICRLTAPSSALAAASLLTISAMVQDINGRNA